MEATELRINNLVQLYRFPKDKEKSVFKVEEIYEDEIDNSYFITVHSDFCVNIKKGVEPIPLTEEWLLKFGFIKNRGQIEGLIDDRYYFERFVVESGISQLFRNGYSFRITTDKQNSTHAGMIKYVHSLQNLYFALTGKELTTSKA